MRPRLRSPWPHVPSENFRFLDASREGSKPFCTRLIVAGIANPLTLRLSCRISSPTPWAGHASLNAASSISLSVRCLFPFSVPFAAARDVLPKSYFFATKRIAASTRALDSESQPIPSTQDSAHGWLWAITYLWISRKRCRRVTESTNDCDCASRN